MALTSPLSPFSAGVGHTGTFITIDHVIEQVKGERSASGDQQDQAAKDDAADWGRWCVHASSELIQITWCVEHS